MAKQLPIIKYQGKCFFKDDRLQQIREVTNPHNFLSFEEVDWDRVKIQVENPVKNMLENMFNVD